MEEHNSFMAKGTNPQIFAIFEHSEAVAFGSNPPTNVWEKDSCNGLILTAWWPWKCTFINSRDSLVVRRNVKFLNWLRITSRGFMKSSFTFGAPLSSKKFVFYGHPLRDLTFCGVSFKEAQKLRSQIGSWKKPSHGEEVYGKSSSLELISDCNCRRSFTRSKRASYRHNPGTFGM